MIDDLASLRSVAEAADQCSRPDGGSRPWLLEAMGDGGYPQRISREADVILVAECYDGIGPEGPWAFAEHIATFDPPMVLALLDEIDRLRAEVQPEGYTIIDREAFRVLRDNEGDRLVSPPSRGSQ